MSLHFLISGATGFLGSALTSRLCDDGHRVTALVRTVDKARLSLPGVVDLVDHLDQIASDAHFDGIINLAGEPIIGKRWSSRQKQQIRASRLVTTQHLVDLVDRLVHKPDVFVSGSAIGYYGAHPGDAELTEDGRAIEGFTHELCRDWEDAAVTCQQFNVRVCLLRTGVVLGKGGGALQSMVLPFKLGIGGPIGNGEQWLSWIHLDDWVDAVVMLLTHPQCQGAYNLTAPEPVTNEQFSKALGKVLHRPVFLRMPASVMSLLMGEAAELVTEGQRVIPRNLEAEGYRFHFPNVEQALENILVGNNE